MILEEIAAATKKRVEETKANIGMDRIKKEIAPKANSFVFEKRLSEPKLSFICEVKRASPSKGMIAEKFPYLDIAKEYEEAGADAISVLTEPQYFLGDNRYLKEIKANVSLPVLRKDFIIDAYQVYEAAALGADAILLICSLLDSKTLRAFRELADSLGLSCLVETHDEAEIESALSAGARVIGVNNRNLRTFQVDLHTSLRLRELVPKEIPFVAESGMKDAKDIQMLKEHGVNAVLIGETLMKAADKRETLARLRGKER